MSRPKRFDRSGPYYSRLSLFVMNWWYGGVPVIDNYNSADEAKVPRKSEEEVKITSIQNWTQPSVN